jgi:hypothetical protein
LNLKNFFRGDIHHDVFLKLIDKDANSKKYTYMVTYFEVINYLRHKPPQQLPTINEPSYTEDFEVYDDSVGEYEQWVRNLKHVRQTSTTYPLSIQYDDGEEVNYDSIIQATEDFGVGRVAVWEWLNGGTLPKHVKTIWKAEFAPGLKIRRKISRQKFDSDDRWQREFEYNEGRGSSYNEWKTVLVHKTMENEAILISEIWPSKFNGKKNGKL